LDPTEFDAIRANFLWSLEVERGMVTPVCYHEFPLGATPAFRLLEVVEALETSGSHGGAVSICPDGDLLQVGGPPGYTTACPRAP